MDSNKHFLLILGVIAISIFQPVKSRAELDVNINVGVPWAVVTRPRPPAIVIIPDTKVYFFRDIEMRILFYRGYWYRPYRGRWYRARHYNGPWCCITTCAVPQVIIHSAPAYKHTTTVYKTTPCTRSNLRGKGWSQRKRYKHGGYD